jgi:two-component system sensor histidine kinase KdpD
MTEADPRRPSPEALLDEARREGRGRLKVFLGAAPGVGKTYDMLRAAQAAQASGIDVVVGIVETHGRAETEALLAGLEVLPRKRLAYRERSFDELDVDALIARRPRLALIDELAHSNLAGSRHVKRWQDVDDVLAAGIDVLTTLNVQHLESLNDVVLRITGVRVRETLPDTVLERADQIELVDLPPDELIQRLEAGKVYLGEQALRARDSFFSRGNLTALRELAMRAAAERVDQQMLAYMRRHQVQGPWPTRDRLLVCVGGDSVGRSLIRAAARLADLRGVAWIAVHVIDSRANRLPDAQKDLVAETLRLAESLGGEAVTIPGEHVADEVLGYARNRNVTQIVLGRAQRPLWSRLRRRSVASELLRVASGFEITLIPGEKPQTTPTREAATAAGWSWRDTLMAAGLPAIATVIGVVFDPLLGLDNFAVLYLLAVLISAVRAGPGPAIVASFIGAACFNFFFTEPRYTLAMTRHQDVVTLIVFLIVAVLMGRLGGQLRSQMTALRKTARRNANLNEFARRVAGALGRDEVGAAAAEHVHATLDVPCVCVLDAPSEALMPGLRRGISPDYQFRESDRAAAAWSWEHSQAAGYSTQTLPNSQWLFVPMATAQRVVGLLGLHLHERGRPLSAGQRRLLDAISDQAAVALERVLLAAQIEDQRVQHQGEALRSALLSSVSHDLRTPLASILGSASSLQAQHEVLPQAGREELVETIIEEAERLNRFVQNLLDMTRLGYGQLEPRREWCDLLELLGRARRRLRREFAKREVKISAAADLPLAHVDALLIEQVLVNVLDNAGKYSPAGSTIEIELSARVSTLQLRVRDHGGGVPAGDRDRIFDMFYRVQSQDHTAPGTGLGLAICRGILQAHGGSIRALSPLDAGSGTVIEITLPRVEPPVMRDD